MKKYLILMTVALVMISCATTKKSRFTPVNQSDVPERYVQDFAKKHADIKPEEVRWEMADTNTYYANFKTTDNTCIEKFTRTGTETFYVIPTEYLPSDISDYVKENHPDFKINDAFITDIKNQKSYLVEISKKQEALKLQFDLKGNFNKIVE